MTKKALLLGAYGQTNLGDDLLLYNYLQYLTDQGFSTIYVNASKAQFIPQVIRDTFPGMEVFETYHTSPLTLFAYMRKADAVFYGGGTVYKEMYATTGRAPYTVIAGVAAFNLMTRLLGKKVYGLHIGIGSIKTRFGRWLSAVALRASTKTIFRDETSYHYALTTLKIPAGRIDQATDGLFLNKGWQKVWRHYQLKHTKKPIIGVNLLSDIPDWVDRDHYITTIRDFLTKLLQEDCYVVLLPFQTDFNPTNDLHFIRQDIEPHIKHWKNYQIADDVEIDTVISVLKQCDVLVGMRLHSLLLATVAETPFLALAYDTKCWRFVTEANYPYALKLEDATTARLIKLYHEVSAAKPAARRQLHTIAKKDYKRADAWLEEFTP